MSEARDRAATWLAESSHVLLAAGAGLSAAAGFDYGDRARFAELFPALHALGFRARYELIGRRLPPPLLWGYWFTHIADVRFSGGTHDVYQDLKTVVGDRDWFAMTSNVDALFARNGFDPQRVYTPQGDYGLLQCAKPCSRRTWDVRPAMKAGLATYDEATGMIDPECVPTCPECGGEVFLNVHLGHSFIADHFQPTGRALGAWLDGIGDERLLVIEVGAGFNTPGVIRWPVERITAALPGARLVRINSAHAEVPEALRGRAVSWQADAGAAVATLATV